MIAVNDIDENEPPPRTLMAMLDSLNSKMIKQINHLKKKDISVANTNKSLQFTQDNVSDLKKRVLKIVNENKRLQKESENYFKQTRDLGRRLDAIEQKFEQADHTQRRKNLLIEGVT